MEVLTGVSVIYKNIDEIVPYENNPRKNAAAAWPVANSIKEFGFKNPVILDKDNVTPGDAPECWQPKSWE